MPIQEVNGGYRWGKSGKVYPTKAQAAKQARAAYASGYKGYQPGGPVTQSRSPFEPNFEFSDKPSSETVHIGGPREEQTQDTFAKDFAKYLLMTGIMSNPKTRRNLGMAKMFRDQGPMGLGKVLGQRAGIEALFRKVGPWATLLQNQGGPLGLGIMGSKRPMSSKISQLLLDPRVAGRMKFAKFLPGIAALGWGLNKFSPRIPGQRGALGQGLGPQFANLASKMFGTRTHEQAMEEFGPGLMGGTLGPKLRDLFTRNRDESPIQEIDVTAQRRQSPEEKAADFNRSIALHEEMLGDRIGETGGESQDFLSGLVPRAAQGTNQMLRAANWARSGPHRKLMAKIASGQMPVRKISSGGGGRK